MSWVRIEDGFFRHRKVIGLSKDAKLLFLAALCHCAESTTDGFLSTPALRLVSASVDVKPAVAAVLVDAGLWHKRADGFDVHDYLEYQPSADDERRRKTAQADRVRRWRQSRNDERNALQGPSLNASPVPLVTPPPNPNPFTSQAFPNSRPPDRAEKAEIERRKIDQLTAERDAIPGILATPSERVRASALALRAFDQLAGEGGKTPNAEHVVDWVWWGLAGVDANVVDELLGWCAAASGSPGSVRYLAKMLRDWAHQRGVEMPAWTAP